VLDRLVSVVIRFVGRLIDRFLNFGCAAAAFVGCDGSDKHKQLHAVLSVGIVYKEISAFLFNSSVKVKVVDHSCDLYLYIQKDLWCAHNI
jgi:hypothetical protein